MALTLHYACVSVESLGLQRLVYAKLLADLVKINPCYEEQQRGKVQLNSHLELLPSGLLKLFFTSCMS